MPIMTTPPARNRRLALVIGLAVVVVFVVAVTSLVSSCHEPGDEAHQYVSPEEEVGPAPGVVE